MREDVQHITNPALTLYQALTLKQNDCGWIRSSMLEWSYESLWSAASGGGQFAHVATTVLREREGRAA